MKRRRLLLLTAGLILLITAAFGAGWQISGLYHDSVQRTAELAAVKAAGETRAQMLSLSQANSRRLEQQLQEIADAPPKAIRTEVLKPVFTHQCVSPEFTELYNTTARRLSRSLSSGEPADAVPGDAAAADGADRR